MIDLSKLSIKKAAAALKSKEISAVELTNAYLERIEKHNSQLNAFITICKKTAIDKANKADTLLSNEGGGPLVGIPIAAKDMFSTKGIKTTAGSNVLENYVPQYSATAVTKLEEVGVIILGKTNQDAWAHGSSGENSDFGPTKNPYDMQRVPGGSSSGSAVSVAASMCLAATGTDTGGSIRLPASFCNLVGLKPTYGSVSRYGIIAMASSLDSIGHMTKTVWDNAQILNATSGYDERDATTNNQVPDNYIKDIESGVKGIKIGLPKEYLNGLSKATKAIVKNAALKLEKLGAKIVDVTLPHTQYGVATYYILQPSEVSSNLARYDGIRYGKNREAFGSEAKRRIILGTYTLSSGYYDAYYLKALKVKRLITEDFTNAFKSVDLILAPTATGPAFKLGEKTNDPLAMYLADIYTVNINIAGVPSLNIPGGFVDNMPVGVQLIGPNFSEKRIYQAAYAFEQETMFFEKTPNL